MSMAAGEYVSVHSQADSEQADLQRESAELTADDRGEHKELTEIYVRRGLDPFLAKEVANQLICRVGNYAEFWMHLGFSYARIAKSSRHSLVQSGPADVVLFYEQSRSKEALSAPGRGPAGS